MSCMRCGRCCIDLLWVSEAEIQAMQYYTAKHGIGEQNRNIDTCPFLDRENDCAIYEARPLICREYECSRDMIADQIDRLTQDNRRPRSIRASVLEIATPFR